MSLRSVKEKLKLVATLVPKNRTADENGTVIDRQGYDSLMLVASVGAEGDTLSASVAIEYQAQHSDDDVTYAACADADITDVATGGSTTGVFGLYDANAEAPGLSKTGYKGVKRYVRIVENRVGTHTVGTPTSAYGVLGHAQAEPVA